MPRFLTKHFLIFPVSKIPESKAQEPKATIVAENNLSSTSPSLSEIVEITPAAPVALAKQSEKIKNPPAPIGNEFEFLLGLESGALNHGPVTELGLSCSAPSGDRCSTSKISKPVRQSWNDHNTSEDHIKSLILARGFNSPIAALDQEHGKVLAIKCELCNTTFRSVLLYNAHKLDEEHRRRKNKKLRLVYLAAEKYSIRRRTKIFKRKKANATDLSKSLKYFHKYPKN